VGHVGWFVAIVVFREALDARVIARAICASNRPTSASLGGGSA
jgi:hypothetical protein